MEECSRKSEGNAHVGGGMVSAVAKSGYGHRERGAIGSEENI